MSDAPDEERFVCLRVPPLSGRTLNRGNGYTEGAKNEEKNGYLYIAFIPRDKIMARKKVARRGEAGSFG